MTRIQEIIYKRKNIYFNTEYDKIKLEEYNRKNKIAEKFYADVKNGKYKKKLF
jgi:hypothetical protein